MRQFFKRFLASQGLVITAMPSQATLGELSINFNKWANAVSETGVRLRGPNRQGTGAHQIKSYIKKLLS